MKLTWEKQSYRRYSARVGPLSVEVRKAGIRGVRLYWIVGEVFGNHHHGDRDKEYSLTEAQEAAEEVAARLLREACAFLEVR